MATTKKSIVYCFFSVLFSLVFFGCVITTGPATQLEDFDKGFVPKKEYSYDYNQMWNKVLQALRAQRILVASASKESHTITTDYIDGWTDDYAAMNTEVFRYRYQIVLDKINTHKTRVDIICKIEGKSMAKGNQTAEALENLKPWQDKTSEQKVRADWLETWLYDKIEKTL
jgi:hypothetical protein